MAEVSSVIIMRNFHSRLLLTSFVGLQCHAAPFSWKIVFECDHELYEIMMSACSPKEELEWRARLTQSEKQSHESLEPDVHSCMYLNIKSLGSVFGKPGKT
jgi:hypothetical protein